MKAPELKYFAFDHLPPHLAKVSAMFSPLAELAAGQGASHRPPTIDQAVRLANDLLDVLPKCSQRARAALKVMQSVWGDDAIHLLLEAKDCAVRAAMENGGAS